MASIRTYLRRSESPAPTFLRRIKRIFLPVDTLQGREFLEKIIPSGSLGAEIGVYRGDFSRWILDVVGPENLTLIDPWVPVGAYQDDEVYEAELRRMDRRYMNVCNRFIKEREAGRVRILRLMSTEAAKLFASASLDWIYIDGDHREEAVRADIINYWSSLKTGGLMIFDDYGYDAGWNDGVTKACDSLLSQPACSKVYERAHQLVIRKNGTLESFIA